MKTTEEFYAWYKREHEWLHRRWTREVGTWDYDKDKWRRKERDLDEEARRYAALVGATTPYLRPTNEYALMTPEEQWAYDKARGRLDD